MHSAFSWYGGLFLFACLISFFFYLCLSLLDFKNTLVLSLQCAVLCTADLAYYSDKIRRFIFKMPRLHRGGGGCL